MGTYSVSSQAANSLFSMRFGFSFRYLASQLMNPRARIMRLLDDDEGNPDLTTILNRLRPPVKDAAIRSAAGGGGIGLFPTGLLHAVPVCGAAVGGAQWRSGVEPNRPSSSGAT
jgi:hypothetical protein